MAISKGIIFDWIGTLYEKDVGLFSQSKNVLIQISRRYKLGLVALTGSELEIRRKELLETGVIPFFDSLIIDKVKTVDHYKKCMREMGTEPEETAIVDDRIINGIKIGNAMGCDTYWICNGEYSKKNPNEDTENPTRIIDGVEDLLNIF